MNILLAPDSFKGTATAAQVAQLLKETIKAQHPNAKVCCMPIADGGEGTLDALLAAKGGEKKFSPVSGPMGQPVLAAYGRLPGGIAAIELAQVAGLSLVPPKWRNPLLASTRGFGELLLQIKKEGYEKLFIGIGGSATNDGGMGMLAALGAKFFDARGNLLFGSGSDLEKVHEIDCSGLVSLPHATVLCDVSNPLLGKEGATAVYAPQKGASKADLIRLEKGMENYVRCFSKLGMHLDRPGGGAAGGIGAALLFVLQARGCRGISAVFETVGFAAALEKADLVITGEGRLDEQTIRYGKGPYGVAEACAKKGIPLLFLAGCLGPGWEDIEKLGNVQVVCASKNPPKPENLERDGPKLLLQGAEKIARAISAR